MADVRLNGRRVELEGDRVECFATDIVLDHPNRRGEGAGGERRALVHDYEDGLTVNWGEDYPGGVTIRGDVRLPGQIESARVESLTIKLHRPRRALAIRTRARPGIAIDPTEPGPEPVPVHELEISGSELETITHVDLATELDDLREMIHKLQQRVTELEAATA